MSIFGPGGYTVGMARRATEGSTALAEQATEDDRAGCRRLAPAGHKGYLSLAKQAEADLRPFLATVNVDHVGEEGKGRNLEKRTEGIAKALATQHRTYGDAVLGLAHWSLDDFASFDARMHELKLSVGDRAALKRALSKVIEKSKEPPSRCAATVKCGDVTLKLSLTPKFMAKPLSDAVLAPFLKAYSKKMGVDPVLTPADIESVELEEEAIEDVNAAVSSIVKSEDVSMSITLKPADWRAAGAPAGAEALADID